MTRTRRSISSRTGLRVPGSISTALASALIVWALTLPVAFAAPPSLSLPIGCTIGPGCRIQNYADNDAGPGVRDFACGGRTYDGHKGTDFRIRDAAEITKGVAVLAAAVGVVKAIRDDMADISIRDSRAGNISGRECGNGVVLDHGDGWVTQYCHLRRGSVRVKPGETVAGGTVLGEVGLSGFAEFAHVHFEVRNGDTIVDPFTGKALGTRSPAQCEHADGDIPLWDARSRAALAYEPAAFLSGGFAGGPVSLDAVEKAAPPAPSSVSPALVAYVRVLGVRAGDMETLTITDPTGAIFSAKNSAAITAPKAQWLSFAGRKRREQSWPPGRYSATYRLDRDGRALVEERFSIDLK